MTSKGVLTRFLGRYFKAGLPEPADVGDVLLDELAAIKLRRAILSGSATETKVAAASATDPGSHKEKLKKFYDAAHKMGNLSALCLSGGGIRSAAFALGVIQGLAERKLLTRFDYLSTVSGGGYIGAFLAAWAQRNGYADVVAGLAGAPAPEMPISPLQHLRRYSSYLSPRVGLLTTDTLTLVALYVRNLLLNWLILIPMLFCGLALIKIIAESVWTIPSGDSVIAFFGASAIAVIGAAVLDSLQQRPGWGDEGSDRKSFLYFEMIPALLGGALAGMAAVKYFQAPALSQSGDHTIVGRFLGPILGTTIIGAIIFLIATILALAFSPPRRSGPPSTMDTIRTIPIPFAILVVTIFTATGAVTGLILALAQDVISGFFGKGNSALVAFLFISLGPPLLITSLFLGELLYCGLTSGLTGNVHWGEAEREWLARAAGYHARAAVTWAIIVVVTFLGSYVVFWLLHRPSGWWLTGFATTGGAAGLITTLVGKASSTAATLKSSYTSLKNLSAAVVLAIATPIFIAVAVSLASALIDWLVVGDQLWFSTDSDWAVVGKLALVALGSFVIGGIASIVINTNQFSLHGLYRNRLIRTFLGASNAKRNPNPFTDFDQNDNIVLDGLWPNARAPKHIPPQFLVVNMSLNVVATRELAWQERKALSFTATPRWIGCGDLSEKGIGGLLPARGYYRPAQEYGGPMSLGTAITISGAAASPNMGYHSSPALSLLLTFFNVRLGAWLGNPNRAGNGTYKRLGPLFAAKPMIQEAFGLTDDQRPYVYLSDGGHFENLGLYEMVRRRCHLIVISDAGCDPTCGFEDLGNALRRISVDLNVDINFRSLKIGARVTPPIVGPYCAVADIIYHDDGAAPGLLLYLKPGYHGGEPPPVRSYAAKSQSFPHESTADQWFRETQFEAYRALGQYIVRTIDGKPGQPGQPYQDIKSFIDAVSSQLVEKDAMTAGKPDQEYQGIKSFIDAISKLAGKPDVATQVK